MNFTNKIAAFITILLGMVMIVSCHEQGKSDFEGKKELYAQIDAEIEKVPVYAAIKEDRINTLKRNIKDEVSPEVKARLTDLLISEYEAYISDSALYYINQNLENPFVKNNKRIENSLLIKKADVAAHAGLFGEASSILGGIDKRELDSNLLENYYSAYADLYQYQSEYAINSEYAEDHERLRELYIDSISTVASPSSINYVVFHAAADVRNGKFTDAENLLVENLNNFKSGDRSYSILASILAEMYKQQGDDNNYQKYICLSVISDLQGAIKENMAIRALATECFKEGDLERADRYLRQSFEDANFYAARMRNAQSSRILPIIGEAYTGQQKKMNHQLSLLVIFMSILAFGFIMISIFAFLQVKKIRKINKKTEGMLKEVSQLSDQLADVNRQLSETNRELQSSNKIKGEYAALFMEYSSLAISALQRYQQSLKVAATQGNLSVLKKKIESSTIENSTISQFYSKFDEAILNIYPHFVEKVNSLLRPEDKIEIKTNEELNTELRVLALIKIGINDSDKIADFLRCSLSTIYTYRSRIKKKAFNPDTFEEDILAI